VIDVANTTDAMVKAWKALEVFQHNDMLKEYDHRSLEQAKEAQEFLADAMGTPYLVSLLRNYTNVKFAVRGSAVCEGMIRDFPTGDGNRRITNLTTGFEFFVTPETDFDYFEVID
jgi:hypothetical protein